MRRAFDEGVIRWCSPPGRWSLSSIVMRPHASGRFATADRHPPGRRVGRRRGHPPVPACPHGRCVRERRHRDRLRGHAVCVPRVAGLAARHPRRAHRVDLRPATRRLGPGARLGAVGARHRDRRAAVRRDARRPRLRLVAGPHRRRGVRRARELRDAVARRAHARAPGPRGARRAAGLPRRRVADPRRGRDRHRADLRRGARLLRLPAARRAPPRGREVRGPAHPAGEQAPEARPDRHRRDEADDAPARDRRRERAGDEGDRRSRDLRRRLRRGVPVGDAGLRRRHRDRPDAGRAPDPVDELVLA